MKTLKQILVLGMGFLLVCLASCSKDPITPPADNCCKSMVTVCYEFQPCVAVCDGVWMMYYCNPWGDSQDPDTVVAYLLSHGVKKVENVQMLTEPDSSTSYCWEPLPNKIMLDVCEKDLKKVEEMGFSLCGGCGDSDKCNTYATVKYIGCYVSGLWGGMWLQLDNGGFLQPWKSSVNGFIPEYDGQRVKLSYTEIDRDNTYDYAIVCAMAGPVPDAAAVKITCIENSQDSVITPVPGCIDPSKINPDIACTMEYDPVCGCDGVTYSNPCAAENWGGVTLWTKGPCKNH